MRVRERVAVLIRRRRHVLLVSDACCGGLGRGGDQRGEMRRNWGGGLRPVVPVQSAAPWVRYRAALAPEDGTHPNYGGRNMGKHRSIFATHVCCWKLHHMIATRPSHRHPRSSAARLIRICRFSAILGPSQLRACSGERRASNLRSTIFG
jgi:hypothetical protein